MGVHVAGTAVCGHRNGSGNYQARIAVLNHKARRGDRERIDARAELHLRSCIPSNTNNAIGGLAMVTVGGEVRAGVSTVKVNETVLAMTFPAESVIPASSIQ